MEADCDEVKSYHCEVSWDNAQTVIEEFSTDQVATGVLNFVRCRGCDTKQPRQEPILWDKSQAELHKLKCNECAVSTATKLFVIATVGAAILRATYQRVSVKCEHLAKTRKTCRTCSAQLIIEHIKMERLITEETLTCEKCANAAVYMVGPLITDAWVPVMNSSMKTTTRPPPQPITISTANRFSTLRAAFNTSELAMDTSTPDVTRKRSNGSPPNAKPGTKKLAMESSNLGSIGPRPPKNEIDSPAAGFMGAPSSSNGVNSSSRLRPGTPQQQTGAQVSESPPRAPRLPPVVVRIPAWEKDILIFRHISECAKKNGCLFTADKRTKIIRFVPSTLESPGQNYQRH